VVSVWKRLLNHRLTFEDLACFDVSAKERIEMIRNLSSSSFSDACGNEIQFVATISTGESVELSPGGRQRRVTSENVDEYCALMEFTLLHQFDRSLAAIREGLGQVIPLRVLRLFVPQELEVWPFYPVIYPDIYPYITR
jgi:hypothetical protein